MKQPAYAERALPPAAAVAWHAARREWSNFSFRRQRRFDGFIATMHQGGTHWLKYMLTLLYVFEHELPLPQSISENLVIGGPRERPPSDLSPRLGQSHTIPHPLLRLLMHADGCGFPRYLVMVRDVRDILIAHYRKWRERYGCEFSEFLRGDVCHRRFEKDLWWDLRFMNAWGAIVAAHPRRTAVLHYERLQQDTERELARIVDFFGIELRRPQAAMAFALERSGKAAMAALDDAPYGMTVVRDEARDWDAWYADADRAWFSRACARYLRHDFGYGYATWATA